MPTNIPTVGRFATIQDPQGATISLITYAKRNWTRDETAIFRSTVLAFLRQAAAETPIMDLCWDHGFSRSTFRRWQAKYSAAIDIDRGRLKRLERENARLRKSLAVERWWGAPEFYRQTEWTAELRVCGQRGVTVRFADGDINHGSGEFLEIDAPGKLVMTRRFAKHPLLGTRETTITYRLDPVATGTHVTVRDEGLVGRSEAAYGNEEHWERVLGWLDAYAKS